MFKAFTRSIPEISIFHNPNSPASTNALRLLRSALSSPYPPSRPSAPPLKFDLEVIENRPPTPDQVRTILSYLPAKAPSGQAQTPSPDVLLSAHPTVDSRPTNPEGVVQLASQNPNALKWPIVVDWHSGKAAVGDVEGVKSILEELRRKRDGEA
ncbi:thioredoxin-like protein [Trametes punicea]|nr:thioredoxin-like protein [Trametes punicea]